MNHEPDHVNTGDDVILESTRGAMEALGRFERDSAPDGLEARVLAASVGALRRQGGGATDAPAPIRFVEHAPAGSAAARAPQDQRRMDGRHRRVMTAIAAGLGAIAAVAGALVVWRGLGPATHSTAPIIADRGGASSQGDTRTLATDLDSEVEALFAASSLLGSEVGGAWEREIASIEVDAAALGLDLADPVAGGLTGVGSSTWGGSL